MVTNSLTNKIKIMSKEQILISVDRLTRFKPTQDKYLRVFKDIILNNLISPSFKKKDLDEMGFVDIAKFATEIFNYSLNSLGLFVEDDFTINKILKEYENSIFKNSEETNILLDNNISYKSIIPLIDEEHLKVKNLLWLTKLLNANQTLSRQQFSTHFPIQKVIIAEGITEEILLPIFSKILGVDFDKYGYHIISAGGKNQVVKAFYSYADILNIPIFVLFDNDAKENLEQIKPKIRNIDKIHLVQAGEFEDLLPINLVIKTLNNYIKNLASVDITDFEPELSMVKNLEEIFKKKCPDDFKKAEFAHLIAENVQTKDDLSDEIVNIIKELQV